MAIIQKEEGAKYLATVQMEIVICCNCAIPFGIPSNKVTELRSSKERFFCPNGHGMSYTTSTEEILRRQIQKQEAEKQTLQNRVEYWSKEFNEAVEKRVEAEKKLKRVENRVAKGVCPCCNRTFQDLASHMEKKHPYFKEVVTKS